MATYLAFSRVYLLRRAWVTKAHAKGIAGESLARLGVAQRALLSTLTAVNELLWSMAAINGEEYAEGHYLLLTNDQGIRMTR